eukprot:1160393-Pelagomonas_calceolata.AAC.19
MPRQHKTMLCTSGTGTSQCDDQHQRGLACLEMNLREGKGRLEALSQHFSGSIQFNESKRS